MIWKEIRTRRGLRRPSETKQGQRAMISLSDAVVCSGHPRAGGLYMDEPGIMIRPGRPGLRSPELLHRFSDRLIDRYTARS